MHNISLLLFLDTNKLLRLLEIIVLDLELKSIIFYNLFRS